MLLARMTDIENAACKNLSHFYSIPENINNACTTCVGLYLFSSWRDEIPPAGVGREIVVDDA